MTTQRRIASSRAWSLMWAACSYVATCLMVMPFGAPLLSASWFVRSPWFAVLFGLIPALLAVGCAASALLSIVRRGDPKEDPVAALNATIVCTLVCAPCVLLWLLALNPPT